MFEKVEANYKGVRSGLCLHYSHILSQGLSILNHLHDIAECTIALQHTSL